MSRIHREISPCAQMEEPGVLVDAVRQIHERDEVLRAEIQLSFRAAEIEGTVFAERAFGIFAQMAAPLGARGLELDDHAGLRRRAIPDQRRAFGDFLRRSAGAASSFAFANSLHHLARFVAEHDERLDQPQRGQRDRRRRHADQQMPSNRGGSASSVGCQFAGITWWASSTIR